MISNYLEIKPETNIHYIYTEDHCIQEANQILLYTGNFWSVWGFDCESPVDFKTGRQHKTSLLQFSNKNDIYLFHLTFCGMPYELIQILQNPKIFLVGINISSNIHKLQKSYPELNNIVMGVIEIKTVMEEFVYFHGCLNCTKAILVEKFLDCEFKRNCGSGRWDRKLNDELKNQAALSALAEFLVYREVFDRAYLGSLSFCSFLLYL
mmetsp:Transcript_18114/g.17440  ORF Transcript_18114/g.17440 Transcript_18114/m.17440 type:complete len:208 (+) Transcript_18114:72-695(+)